MSARINDFTKLKEKIPPKVTQCGVELTLAVDNWDMGWEAMSLGWAGWGAYRARGICTPFPLLYCPTRKK